MPTCFSGGWPAGEGARYFEVPTYDAALPLYNGESQAYNGMNCRRTARCCRREKAFRGAPRCSAAP
jgi:hypothetical protein